VLFAGEIKTPNELTAKMRAGSYVWLPSQFLTKLFIMMHSLWGISFPLVGAQCVEQLLSFPSFFVRANTL